AIWVLACTGATLQTRRHARLRRPRPRRGQRWSPATPAAAAPWLPPLGMAGPEAALLTTGGGCEEDEEEDGVQVESGAPRPAACRASLAVGLCGALASGALLAALRLRPEWRRRAGSLLQRRQWPDGASLPRLLRGFVGGAEAGGHEGLLAHVAWELEQEAELDTWQMLQVQAAIYSQPRASSEQTGVLQHCSIVQGKSLGDGWVQLKDQQGYAPQRAK
ncbi:unnamed protein product, partial [Prorocentrum cordatum]